jgi:hypothetical protein
VIYLVQYDRSLGQLIRLDAFPSGSKDRAEETRLSVELDLLSKKVSHEVVLLEVKNEDELRKTHRRYFERLDQLMMESPAAAQ